MYDSDSDDSYVSEIDEEDEENPADLEFEPKALPQVHVEEKSSAVIICKKTGRHIPPLLNLVGTEDNFTQSEHSEYSSSDDYYGEIEDMEEEWYAEDEPDSIDDTKADIWRVNTTLSTIMNSVKNTSESFGDGLKRQSKVVENVSLQHIKIEAMKAEK